MDFAASSDPAVQAQLDRLAALSLPHGRFGLETIRALLGRLGNPETRLPPLFHVAGTNGKGSTCAFLRAALEAAGHRVHVYTSPHLVRFNERIRVAGRLIEDDALAALLKRVLDAGEDLAPSFFEVATAAAFLAFAETPAEACVIEVGLGGRFDATNVIPAPAVCGIASLGIDHEAFLLAPEDNVPAVPIARIAFEKAGIAKPGVPLVTLAYPELADLAVAATAEQAGAPLLRHGRDWSVERSAAGLAYRDRAGALDLPCPALPGAHQARNAGLATAMLRHQSAIVVGPEAIRAGVASARWLARLHRLAPGPLREAAGGRSVWLDGGHNPDAGAALAAHFAGARALHLIVGMLANKDPAAIVAPLRERTASLTVVPVPGHESHPPAAFPGARAAADVATALARLPPGGEVLIAGSLYLAGEVLRLNGEAPD
jgi:dihydrofolate synthase/folylpolyglutamate synthase